MSVALLRQGRFFCQGNLWHPLWMFFASFNLETWATLLSLGSWLLLCILDALDEANASWTLRYCSIGISFTVLIVAAILFAIEKGVGVYRLKTWKHRPLEVSVVPVDDKKKVTSPPPPSPLWKEASLSTLGHVILISGAVAWTILRAAKEHDRSARDQVWLGLITIYSLMSLFVLRLLFLHRGHRLDHVLDIESSKTEVTGGLSRQSSPDVKLILVNSPKRPPEKDPMSDIQQEGHEYLTRMEAMFASEEDISYWPEIRMLAEIRANAGRWTPLFKDPTFGGSAMSKPKVVIEKGETFQPFQPLRIMATSHRVSPLGQAMRSVEVPRTNTALSDISEASSNRANVQPSRIYSKLSLGSGLSDVSEEVPGDIQPSHASEAAPTVLVIKSASIEAQEAASAKSSHQNLKRSGQKSGVSVISEIPEVFSGGLGTPCGRSHTGSSASSGLRGHVSLARSTSSNMPQRVHTAGGDIFAQFLANPKGVKTRQATAGSLTMSPKFRPARPLYGRSSTSNFDHNPASSRSEGASSASPAIFAFSKPKAGIMTRGSTINLADLCSEKKILQSNSSFDGKSGVKLLSPASPLASLAKKRGSTASCNSAFSDISDVDVESRPGNASQALPSSGMSVQKIKSQGSDDSGGFSDISEEEKRSRSAVDSQSSQVQSSSKENCLPESSGLCREVSSGGFSDISEDAEPASAIVQSTEQRQEVHLEKELQLPGEL